VSDYSFIGFQAEAYGLGLTLLGILLAVPTGLRLLFVLRRPDKARLARAVAAAGLVLLVFGAALFLGAQYPPLRRPVNLAVYPISVAAVLCAIAAGLRAGRRRTAPKKAGAAEAEKAEKPAEPAKVEQA
jgi:hypothetical protein